MGNGKKEMPSALILTLRTPKILKMVHHGGFWAACCYFQMVAVTSWWAVDGCIKFLHLETVRGHSALCAMVISFTAWKHMHFTVK